MSHIEARPLSSLRDNAARIGFIASALQSQISANHQSPDDLKQKEQKDYIEEAQNILTHVSSSTGAPQQPADSILPLVRPNREISFPHFSKEPTHKVAQQAFAAFTKAYEIQLRFNDISAWDETHAKVLELLTDRNTRDSLSLEEYRAVMQEFEHWCHFVLPHKQSIRGRRGLFQSALPMSQQPGLTLSLFYSCPAVPNGHEGNFTLPKPSSPLTSPEDTLAFTVSTSPSHRIDARVLFQKYVKSISIVKTEAELIMCDGDGDGRVTMAELETYMAEIIPTVTALQHMSEGMIPFYTCSSARRIFWILDPAARGTLKISSFVNHSVVDDWLEVQMMAEEQTRNWFGLTIATQLRDKFEILDLMGTSTLNLECMLRYKKGIPMVIDDGLPKDISPLSTLFLERVFETNHYPKGEMDYPAFVDFVVAIEFLPASCPRPNFFWRVFDIFGEGRITPLVVHSFFKETYAKLKSAEVEVAAIEIIIQELFDLIPSKEPLVITQQEFTSAKQCGLFAALLIDCLAFYTYENREQK